VTFQDVFGTL